MYCKQEVASFFLLFENKMLYLFIQTVQQTSCFEQKKDPHELDSKA